MLLKAEKFIPLASGAFLLLSLSFAVGLFVGAKKVWPHKVLAEGYQALLSMYYTGAIHPPGAWSKAMVAERVPRKRVTIYNRRSVMPGFRAIMGYDGRTRNYAVWLFDETGVQHHAWPVDYSRIDPDGPLGGSSEPHGLAVLRDGSLLVNFDMGDALARLNSCGEPIWVADGVYHHNIEVAEDGSIWTWRGEDTAYGHLQFIENIDPATGNRIRSLDLLQIFKNNLPEAALIFRVPATYRFGKLNNKSAASTDIFHPNDVEPLPRKLAAAFPRFESGDLLVSFRSSDLIAVLNPNNGIIKWWRQGPWRFQHDPDFHQDGTITVFDNNPEAGRSSIIAVSPSTGVTEHRLENNNLRFYSDWGGEHEHLPNGNWLIVSPTEGKVMEVDANGSIVYEFNNLLTSEYNAYILRGKWLPREFFFQKPTCQ